MSSWFLNRDRSGPGKADAVFGRDNLSLFCAGGKAGATGRRQRIPSRDPREKLEARFHSPRVVVKRGRDRLHTCTSLVATDCSRFACRDRKTCISSTAIDLHYSLKPYPQSGISAWPRLFAMRGPLFGQHLAALKVSFALLSARTPSGCFIHRMRALPPPRGRKQQEFCDAFSLFPLRSTNTCRSGDLFRLPGIGFDWTAAGFPPATAAYLPSRFCQIDRCARGIITRRERELSLPSLHAFIWRAILRGRFRVPSR